MPVFPHLLEQHHIVPLGEAEHTQKRYVVFLCPNCHRLVHLFRRLLHGNISPYQAEDLTEWKQDAEVPEGYIARIKAIAKADIAELERNYGITFKAERRRI